MGCVTEQNTSINLIRKIKDKNGNYINIDLEDIRKQDSFTIVHFNDTNSYVKYNNYSNNSYTVDTDSYPDSYEYISYVVKLDNTGNLNQIGNNVKTDGDISLMGWNIDLEGYTLSEAEPYDEYFLETLSHCPFVFFGLLLLSSHE